MKLKPRKHLERQGVFEVNVGSSDTAVVYDDRTKEEVERTVQGLEKENLRLKKQLEDIDYDKKNLSSERLQKIRIASPAELQELRNKLKICESELTNNVEILAKYKAGMVVKRNDRIVDKSDVARRMGRIHAALMDSTPTVLSENERDRLYRRKKELEQKLKPMRVSQDDQWNTRDSYTFSDTVNKIVDYQRYNSRYEVELRNINRLLEPDNPLSGNLGYLDREA